MFQSQKGNNAETMVAKTNQAQDSLVLLNL